MVKTLTQKPIKIGLTLGNNVSQFLGVLWSHGIGQNVTYLAMLLSRMPNVECCFIAAESDNTHDMQIAGMPVLTPEQALAHIDVLIEIGLRLGENDMAAFRARGGKYISYMAGNAMIMNLESVANNTSTGEIPSPVGFDAAWMTPQHWHTNRGYCELTRSKIVRKAPHIWHPYYLLASIEKEKSERYFYKQHEPSNWKIGVFDPTVNVVKTFHLPLLVCEEAQRLDPALIKSVLLFSTARFAGNLHFEELIASTDLGKAKKVHSEDRYPIASVLGRHVEAVVTHQWENDLNYLYWDVLYAGRPLIHNCEPLKEVGAYYRPFEPKDGGRVMEEALKRHDSRPLQERVREMEYLWQYNIENPLVIAAYQELLQEVMECQA
jgi:Protein of unknown function (DUF2827)